MTTGDALSHDPPMSGANDGPAKRRRATPLRRALGLKPDQLRRRVDPKTLPFATPTSSR